MRVDWELFEIVAVVLTTLLGCGGVVACIAIVASSIEAQKLFAPECSAEQAEVLGPGTYRCLTLENGKRVWWKVEEE